MANDIPLSREWLGAIPQSTGVLVILNGDEPLYVGQSERMRSWAAQVLNPEKSNYVRSKLAARLIPDGSQLSNDAFDTQVLEILPSLRVLIYPQPDRQAAIDRKNQLIAQLHPTAQWSGNKRGNPKSEQTDRLRYVLRAAGKLSHLDESGRPRMVDVSGKAETAREATAAGRVVMSTETLQLAVSGAGKKGDVLTTARLAGIMAAKRTHELIPLCHPLPLTAIDVDLVPDEAAGAIEITATVRTTAKTGVEMEALTAVSVAALTVYDMLKAAQKDIRITDIRLVRKTGGKSGDYLAPRETPS